MRLSMLGYVEPKEMIFNDPYTNEPTPIKLKIYPKNSKIGKQAEHQMRLEMLELLQDEKNIDEKTKNLKTELIETITFNYFASLIDDWEGITNDKDKPIKFSKEECIKAFKECNELCDAVFKFVDDKEVFQMKQKES